MDDEVFVTVEYRDDDFVRVRRLMLLERLRETNSGHIVLFVVIAAFGTLFLAPDPIGRIFASAAGALIALMALLVGAGWMRAARSRKLPIEHADIEISSSGVVIKGSDDYHRSSWRDFEGVREGLGTFWWTGKLTVVVPSRCLRDDQRTTLRALVAAHSSQTGSDRGSALAPAAEQHDEGRS